VTFDISLERNLYVRHIPRHGPRLDEGQLSAGLREIMGNGMRCENKDV
jgi:hypothetical protein